MTDHGKGRIRVQVCVILRFNTNGENRTHSLWLVQVKESSPFCHAPLLIMPRCKSTQRAHSSVAEATHYSHIAQIPDLENQHDDPDHPRNVIKCSCYHSTVFLRISSKSAHLRNGQISNWAVTCSLDYTARNPSMNIPHNLFITC